MTDASGTDNPTSPDPDLEERTDPRFRDRLESMLPETVKKLALAGMGAIFMTEEGIRNAVGDMKLPREAVSSLLAQTEKARTELFRLIALELRRFLEQANLAGELRKVLTGLSMDVHASISFRQTDDGSLRPEVASKSARSKPKQGGAGRRARPPAGSKTGSKKG